VVFLLSGGASALFERPYIPIGEMRDVTSQLLASGASIVESNTVRKRLSMVKGGRFALHCAPAQVYAVALSDILGDRPDMIASGPVAPDPSTCKEALAVVQNYGLHLSVEAMEQLQVETPKEVDNATMQVTGSVQELCQAGVKAARAAGYKPLILTDRLDCEAREAGRLLGSIAATQADHSRKIAFFAGGETVVHLTGNGKGGRNQELALAAAPLIEGKRAAVFSFGSDGTDGPTDAAGGYVDGFSAIALRQVGIDVAAALHANDANTALGAIDGLLVTGPTGTNVNDLACVLVG
jgi:hydroxypyruvate reductase